MHGANFLENEFQGMVGKNEFQMDQAIYFEKNEYKKF